MNTAHDRCCFIHIGAPKTGSTAVQRYCCDHRDELANLGLYYPRSATRGFGHHDFAFLLSGGYPNWATPQEKSLDTLTAEFKQETDGVLQDILISSENFYLLSDPRELVEWLHVVFEGQDISYRVVAYVRRQDDAHESWYNQTVKAQGYTHDITECIEEFFSLWDYQQKLRPWAAAFGAENLIVRRYPQAGCVVSDFLEVTGVDLHQLTISDTRENCSINADILEFQRIVNRLPLANSQKRRFHRELTALTRATDGTSLFAQGDLIGQPGKQAIMERYRSSNRWVSDTFFGGEQLFTPSASNSPAAEPQLTTEKLAMILGWIMCKKD